MKTLSKILIFLFFVQFVSCNNASRLEKTPPKDEVLSNQLLKQIKQNKASQDEIEALEQEFSQKQNVLLAKYKETELSNSNEKWYVLSTLIDEIEQLQKPIQSIGEIRAKNGYQAHFKYIDIENLRAKSNSEAFNYYKNIGDQNYEQAVKLFDKQEARKAYESYKKALDFESNDLVKTKMDEVQKLGIIRVATLIGTDVSFGTVELAANSEYTKYNSLLEQLFQFKISPWVEVVQSNNVINQQVDCVIWLGINDLEINTFDGKTTSEQIREVVVIPNSKGAGQAVDVVKNSTVVVSTKQTYYEVKKADVDLSLQIINPINRLTQVERKYFTTKSQTYKSSSKYTVTGTSNRGNSNKKISDKELVKQALDDIRFDVQADIQHQINFLVN